MIIKYKFVPELHSKFRSQVRHAMILSSQGIVQVPDNIATMQISVAVRLPCLIQSHSHSVNLHSSWQGKSEHRSSIFFTFSFPFQEFRNRGWGSSEHVSALTSMPENGSTHLPLAARSRSDIDEAAGVCEPLLSTALWRLWLLLRLDLGSLRLHFSSTSEGSVNFLWNVSGQRRGTVYRRDAYAHDVGLTGDTCT